MKLYSTLSGMASSLFQLEPSSRFFLNLEWRMSISLAEKKLIHAISHIQFTENLHERSKRCANPFCMKTALFWEITTTSNQWTPSSLLSCFWNILCRLLQWVRCSYYPNFFVPGNNMFEGKIEGTNRIKL